LGRKIKIELKGEMDMTTKELITLMSDSKNKMLKVEQLEVVLKKKLEVKEYISIKSKKALVDDIVNECILYEDGIFKFNDIEKYICFTMRVIEAYTNLELSNDLEEEYDLLCESKLLESIINTFKKEYDDVNILLQMKCDYVLTSNTLAAQAGRFFDGVLEKIDVLVDALANKVDGFDFKNLHISGEDLGKLMQFINKQK
jgi:hypothetical protein